MQYFKFSTFMNFLRRNAKATAKCSRPCENIIRSFVNGGADFELARSQPANSKLYLLQYSFAILPEHSSVLAMLMERCFSKKVGLSTNLLEQTQAHALTFCIAPYGA
jgi:hypothetical protein